MECWNQLVQTAMLGTGKQVTEPVWPQSMEAEVTIIKENGTLDAEERFLQFSGLAFNYRQSGMQPLHKEGIALPPAPSEEKPYCNAIAEQALNDLLEEETIGLLAFWLEQCNKASQLAPPMFLPALLEKATRHKTLRTGVEQVMGKRGQWLSAFNKDWHFTTTESSEERWQTGTTDQRKQVLLQLRTTDPALARQWLQDVWPQENANNRAELLKALHINANTGDLDWLESLLKDKSQKVKDEALLILKRIPAAVIIQQYQQAAQQIITLKTEKALLGLSSKTVIHTQFPVTTEEALYKTGIEKLSNQKEYSDDEFILYQLLQAIPPDYWLEQWKISAPALIELLQKHESTKKYIPALALAALQFNNKEWALHLMQYSEVFYMDLLPLLPAQQQEFYSAKFFKGYEETVIRAAINRNEEWGEALAKQALTFMAQNPYGYNRGFYNKHAHLLPVALLTQLDDCAPAEEYTRSTWRNTSDYLRKLLQLKQKTKTAFL